MNSQIKDRQRTTDVIADVMHANWPSWTIDTLLCHPHDAIWMAQQVCNRLSRKATRREINEICRIALSSRKRGDLRRDVL